MHRRALLLSMAGTVLNVAGATAAAEIQPAAGLSRDDLALLNRLTWGANESVTRDFLRLGKQAWLQQQLRAGFRPGIPQSAQQQIAALAISTQSAGDLVRINMAADQARAAASDGAAAATDEMTRQHWLAGIYQQTVQRSLLRDLYSPNQLLQQMTWFWMNHFNVLARKRHIYLYVADFEERAIRPHALGKFGALLAATARHPAMLSYLDNDQNAVGHSNENYARELMELHTLGIDGGYTQTDVQELARIFTGVGVDERPMPAHLRPGLIRDGEFEFDPVRHDYGDKHFLGHTIKGAGYEEVAQALDILSHHPSTAHFVSKKLAEYFVGSDASPATIDLTASAFKRTNGDIAEVLTALFNTPQFSASLKRGVIKDPVHYALSAVRLAYGDRPISVDSARLSHWISILGEGLYLHETPDGYSLDPASWTGPGQLDQRFAFANAIASVATSENQSGAAPGAVEHQLPDIRTAFFDESVAPTLSRRTKAVLAAATTPHEWNALFLSSPEFMLR